MREIIDCYDMVGDHSPGLQGGGGCSGDCLALPVVVGAKQDLIPLLFCWGGGLVNLVAHCCCMVEGD